MRLLLSLVAVAALAACSRNTEDNSTGQAPPETGQVAPADTAAPTPATGVADTTSGGAADTSMTRLKPDTAKGGFDTTKTTTGPVDTSTVTPPTTPPPTTEPTTPPPTTPDSSTGMPHDSM